jgi:hypothetical protein
MTANLILIDLHDASNQWRLKMFEGQRCVSEAICPPMSQDDTLAAIDGWRAQMFWAKRDQYLPRNTR